MQTSAMGKN